MVTDKNKNVDRNLKIVLKILFVIGLILIINMINLSVGTGRESGSITVVPYLVIIELAIYWFLGYLGKQKTI
jgi:hypothetical protein